MALRLCSAYLYLLDSFTVHSFKEDPDNPPHPEDGGKAVMLYTEVDEKVAGGRQKRYKVVSCETTHEIKVETMVSMCCVSRVRDCILISDGCVGKTMFSIC